MVIGYVAGAALLGVLIGIVAGIAMFGEKPPVGILHMIFDSDSLADIYFEVTGGDVNAIAKERTVTLIVSAENAPK